MNVVGKVGSLISQGVYSVATPFHPFGGAVDIIVVQQQDGSFRSTPWYVRFGKFQGVLKGAEKIVRIGVNGVEANFHMYLDNSGGAYFVREVVSGKDDKSNGVLKDSDRLEIRQEDSSSEASVHMCRIDSSVSDSAVVQLQDEDVSSGANRIQRTESDGERRFYEFQDEDSSREGSVELSEYGSNHYESLDSGEKFVEPQRLNTDVVLVCVDGHVLMAPISASEGSAENVQLSTPQFHLGPGEETDFVEGNEEFSTGEDAWAANYINELDSSSINVASENVRIVESSSINVESENGRIVDSSSSNIEHQVEVFKEEEEHVCHTQESQNMANQETDSLRHGSSENCSAGIRREDIFKSCLELSELAGEVGNAYLQDKGSALNVLEVAEDSQEKSPRSLPAVGDTELEDAIKVESPSESSPFSSDSRGNTYSPDLCVEAEPTETNESGTEHLNADSISVHSVNGPEWKDEQFDAASEAEELTISSPRPVPEDECQKCEIVEPETATSNEEIHTDSSIKFEISLCGSELREGMGLAAAADAFDSHRISEEEFKLSAESIIKNENLIIRYKERYWSWDKAAPIVLGMAAYGLDLVVEPKDAISVEEDDTPKTRDDDSPVPTTPSGRIWRLWPIPFRRVKTIEHTSISSNEEVFVDSESETQNLLVEPTPTSQVDKESPRKQLVRTNIPTSEQIASLNLKEGQNIVTFNFSTRVLGPQQVDAHIYLWKWNARIVISDVDGTITRSDVLGQFMPLVGKDWTQSGVARLFCAIKENGYQLLFLSARAIVQAYLTRSFLLNLKQDGKTLPNGPVVISPDGLFPSLYREVIRRAPHEFKIACLEDIRALFPSDYNPFYAGFGNRDTDELSYRKMGIPKGKIFIINPKGEVAISHRIDVKSYTSLHTLVNDMFPPTSLVEQEDYNAWNYWRVPLPDVD